MLVFLILFQVITSLAGSWDFGYAFIIFQLMNQQLFFFYAGCYFCFSFICCRKQNIFWLSFNYVVFSYSQLKSIWLAELLAI